MGQKTNPIGFRLGVNRTWDSRWFAEGANYGRLLHQDLKLRTWLKERLNAAGVSRIIIERPHKKCRVTIYAARPGVVIGKKGADIEKLRRDIAAQTEGEVFLNIIEVRRPEADAQLIAENIAQQLERRIAFRRAMKRAMQSATRAGAKGVRINVSGRLGGAEIARMEWYREGRVPLHTLRADIDYGFTEAKTTYGIIGVKVWVFKGEVLEHDPMAQDRRWAAEAAGPSPNEGRTRGSPRGDQGPRRHREGYGFEKVPAERPAPQPSPLVRPVSDPPRPVAAPAPTANVPERVGDALEVAQTSVRLGRVLSRIRQRPDEVTTADMSELLCATSAGLRLGLSRSPLRYQVADIVPALVDGLTSPAGETRWAAAYAIASLTAPADFPNEDIRPPEVMDVRAALEIVRRFLARCGASAFTELSDVMAARTTGSLVVKGTAGVSRTFPRFVKSDDLVLPDSVGVESGGKLRVEVVDALQHKRRRFHATDPAAMGQGRLLASAFEYDFEDRPLSDLHVSLWLDGRLMGERTLAGDLIEQLAAAST